MFGKEPDIVTGKCAETMGGVLRIAMECLILYEHIGLFVTEFAIARCFYSDLLSLILIVRAQTSQTANEHSFTLADVIIREA